MIKVAILWHMHQPYYVDPLTKTAMMPWVRIHAVKGYLDMIDLARKFPVVKMSFNFTPVLVKQLLELKSGEVTDLWESWSRVPAEELSDDEKSRILENFYKINWSTLIETQPRYAELLELRGRDYDLSSLKESIRHFSAQDYRDLQTWYNLAWCGFSAEERFPELTELKAKNRNFTEEEKNRVLDIHHEIIGLVLDEYRAAVADGQVEVTTTPFYHPIMPLVYDTNFAERCMPGREFPEQFTAPEDVARHLHLAQEQHEEVFGERAKGLWPSEGSVAPELIPLFQEAGIEYFCTDEEVWLKSLEAERGIGNVEHLELFQPWVCEYQGSQVKALFRERPLSDFIGFNAARNTAMSASDHLIHHLEHLETVVHHPNGVVPLILDGENAWEAFLDGGEEFLSRFYTSLDSSNALDPVRLQDVMSGDGMPYIHQLHTGSWIGGNFDIWIGDPEENRGWELIGKTREFLVDYLANNSVNEDTKEKLWREIYAAEGSDWFWWYGPDFQTDCDFLFDALFRKHLENVYHLLGVEPPDHLLQPIRVRGLFIPFTVPSAFINPSITEEASGFYEWHGAGHMDLRRQQTAMFQADRVGKEIYFGFNQEEFFFRFDYETAPKSLVVSFIRPEERRIWIERQEDGSYSVRVASSDDGVSFESVDCPVRVANLHHLEVGIQQNCLDIKGSGEDIAISVQVMDGDVEVERYPERGLIEFAGPSPQFQLENWFV